MKALLTNYHQSPRKVRLIADLVRGKSVSQAKAALAFMTQKSAPAIEKLLDSAVSNARQVGESAENLFVKTIEVNKGIAMRRFKPMARGRSARYSKTMSIVSLELGTLGGAKPKAAKKIASKTASKKPSTTKKPKLEAKS